MVSLALPTRKYTGCNRWGVANLPLNSYSEDHTRKNVSVYFKLYKLFGDIRFTIIIIIVNIYLNAYFNKSSSSSASYVPTAKVQGFLYG
jgi:hypothetical protein